MPMQTAEHDPIAPPRRSPWKMAWLILAVAYAAPIAYTGYNKVIEVTREARERLIVQHRLWELDPGYRGTPQIWTRVASRLLTDNQLMRRVRLRYGELTREIELDYRRDLSLAQVEVIAIHVAAWGIPVGALYGLGLLVLKRRRVSIPPPPPAAPPASDARYRP
jgi:hypothetical protein